VKPKRPKEVKGHDTANDLSVQDRDDKGEINGPRRFGIDGGVQPRIGLRALTDRFLPVPGSNRGFDPSVLVDSLVLMLQGGGRSLEDLRELKHEEG